MATFTVSCSPVIMFVGNGLCGPLVDDERAKELGWSYEDIETEKERVRTRMTGMGFKINM